MQNENNSRWIMNEEIIPYPLFLIGTISIFIYAFLLPVYVIVNKSKIFSKYDLPIPLLVVSENVILAFDINIFEPAIWMIYVSNTVLVVHIYLSYIILYVINKFNKNTFKIKIIIFITLFIPPIILWKCITMKILP